MPRAPEGSTTTVDTGGNHGRCVPGQAWQPVGLGEAQHAGMGSTEADPNSRVQGQGLCCPCHPGRVCFKGCSPSGPGASSCREALGNTTDTYPGTVTCGLGEPGGLYIHHNGLVYVPPTVHMLESEPSVGVLGGVALGRRPRHEDGAS